MNIENHLKDAGLTRGESKVYMSLLELGESTTGPLVEKSGISRSIIYNILDRLMRKGLVSYITKEKTKYFQATHPSKIIDYMDERLKIIGKNRKEIELLIPAILSKQKSGEKSDIRVFKGINGIITVHENIYFRLGKGEEYFYMGIPAYQPESLHSYFKRDHIRRIKAGIKIRALFHPDTDRKILKNRNSYRGCDARYMPIRINSPAWFVGYRNVAVIGMPSSSPVTIEIMNKEIADSFRAYFEEFWGQSKPLSL